MFFWFDKIEINRFRQISGVFTARSEGNTKQLTSFMFLR